MTDTALSPLFTAIDADNDEDAEAAVLALCETNAAALPLLVGLTQSPVDDYRWWAVRGLAELGEDDPAHRMAVMPLLARCLTRP